MKKILLSALTIAASMSAYAAYEDLNKVLYLPLDAVSATLENKCGDAATLIQGDGAKAIEGAVKGGAEFDGNTYYGAPNSSAFHFGENDFTIELFFKATTDLKGYALLMGCNSDEGTPEQNGHWIGIEFKDPNILFALKSNTDGKKSQAGLAELETYKDGEWHHLIAVRDHANTTVDLYFDGELANSSTDKTKAIEINSPCYIGANPSPSVIASTAPFTGALDEISILNGALSMDEVSDRYTDLTVGAGIQDVIASMTDGVATVYTIDGVKVAEGADFEALKAGLDKNLYVVVISNGVERQVKKVLVK